MTKSYLHSDLVSVDWLNEELGNPNLLVLDASIKKVTSDTDQLVNEQVPSAQYFDIKNKFSDVQAQFPNTVPSEEQFTNEAQLLGINQDSLVVVYDDKGIYSSARAWYLFKSFGFDNVAVLDGGLPKWKNSGYKVEAKTDNKKKGGNFISSYKADKFYFFDDIIKLSNDENHLVVDARSSNRFNSLVPEPRKGLRSGSIPNSVNIPFSDLMEDNCLKNEEELSQIFKTVNPKNKAMVFSCGSGITACVLALGATIANYENTTVYDGSWTEYGSLTT